MQLTMKILFTFAIIFLTAIQSNAQERLTTEDYKQFFNETQIAKVTDSTYLVHIDLIKTANLIFAEHRSFKYTISTQKLKIQSLNELVDEKDNLNTLQHSLFLEQSKLIDTKDAVISSQKVDIHNLINDNTTLKKKQLIPWLIAGASTIVTILVVVKH